MCIHPDKPFKCYLTICQQKLDWHLLITFHPKGIDVELFKEIYKDDGDVIVRTYDRNVFYRVMDV